MSITVPQWNKKDKLGRGGYEKYKNWLKDKQVLIKINCVEQSYLKTYILC